jgi:hypothetical protein
MRQRDLFGRRPSAPLPQRSVSKTPLTVEPFEFDGSDPRLVPQPDAVIPPELRLPTDDENWMPGAPI